MEVLYQNKLLTIALTIAFALLAGNFGSSVYMLNAPPVVVRADLSDFKAAYGVSPAAFQSWFTIHLNTGVGFYQTIRHEYQHYIQSALLTPFGAAIGYQWQHFVLGKDYYDNWFEIDARRVEHDGLNFKVFVWNTKELKLIMPGQYYYDLGVNE